MSNNTICKVLHTLSTVVMMVIIGSYLYFQHQKDLTISDRLYSSRQLTPRTWLYITEYIDSDSTTGNVYRYFLAGETKGEPLAELEKAHIAPTLTTNTPDAKVDGIGNNISFTVRGTIYNFSSTAFFYDNDGVAVSPAVDLTARGEGWERGR